MDTVAFFYISIKPNSIRDATPRLDANKGTAWLAGSPDAEGIGLGTTNCQHLLNVFVKQCDFGHLLCLYKNGIVSKSSEEHPRHSSTPWVGHNELAVRFQDVGQPSHYREKNRRTVFSNKQDRLARGAPGH